MLLIPKAIHDILERGRTEGRRELLERFVADRLIIEERREEIEAKLRLEHVSG
ncbi:MAG: hypothetical protein OXC99_13070 [Chloroflexi bacterium]|nr:hypothetical protein [Chloroflexota bacterium]